MSTLLKVLDSALEREGYDGLFNADCECGCQRGDLSPGNCLSEDCEPGYKSEGQPAGAEDGGYAFWIVRSKDDVRPKGGDGDERLED